MARCKNAKGVFISSRAIAYFQDVWGFRKIELAKLAVCLELVQILVPSINNE
jgi:hypothetical protein